MLWSSDWVIFSVHSHLQLIRNISIYSNVIDVYNKLAVTLQVIIAQYVLGEHPVRERGNTANENAFLSVSLKRVICSVAEWFLSCELCLCNSLL